MQTPNDDSAAHNNRDAAEAIRFMAVKAAIFIALPMLAAVSVAVWMLQ